MDSLTVITDIETGSFWGDILCAHAALVESEDRFDFSADPSSGLPGLDDYLALLNVATRIVGHNYLGYDARCLVKRLGAKIDFSKIADTLTASRLAWPDLREADLRQGTMPAQLLGHHSLEAWGYRLGILKGDFAKPPIGRAGRRRCRLTASATWT